MATDRLDSLRGLVLSARQRRTVEELTLDLDPNAGDVAAKRSAFWTMLTLSAVIATTGVLTDSTATVIGAMIIAPLSTPIMGVAFAAAKREPPRAANLVVSGAALVVLVGMAFSALLPGSYNLQTNSQITGRTSPGLLDLFAALATGLAGAVALARKDVAAVLPGVAIAISLVPPLAVVGVCLGRGDGLLASGAAVLFLNLVSLLAAGLFVFAFLAYRDPTGTPRPTGESRHGSPGGAPRRRSQILWVTLALGVAVPLVANTALTAAVSVWTARVESAAEAWLTDDAGAEVTGVEKRSTTF